MLRAMHFYYTRDARLRASPCALALLPTCNDRCPRVSPCGAPCQGPLGPSGGYIRPMLHATLFANADMSKDVPPG